jgi:hypothetical protein
MKRKGEVAVEIFAAVRAFVKITCVAILMALVALTARPDQGIANQAINEDGRTARVLLVSVSGDVPGFGARGLRRYVIARMQTAIPQFGSLEALAPRATPPAAADRIEWTFKLYPYAGGSVRRYGSLVRPTDIPFGVHRRITAEARLFRDGELRSSASADARIHGGARDHDLALLVGNVARSLVDSVQIDAPRSAAALIH